MRIVCIGQCAFDMTFPIQEPLIENQKYRIMEPFSCIGGPAANAACLNAMWGAETSLISRCGKDFYGKEIKWILRNSGVDVTHVLEEEGFTTPLSAIIANASNGCRTIFNCPGLPQEQAFTYPKHADALLLDGHELPASLEALDRYPQAISVMDAGTYHKETSILAQRVTYLVCSQDYARQYTGEDIEVTQPQSWQKTFAALHELHAGTIVVTLGEQGLLYEENNSILHMDAFAVDARDTTGAGDIFHGAFTYCMAKGYTIADALRISSAAGAICVQTLGGQTSIPDKDMMNRFLQDHRLTIKLL